MAFDIYVIVLLFVTGLFVGLLNVLIASKRPLGLKRIGSYCNKCNEEYLWYELIPVFSYVYNLGKCPYCKHKISYWYPILELMTAVMFSMSYVIYGFSYEMIVMIILTILMVNIFVSDFKYLVILDGTIYIASVIVLVLKFLYFGFKTFILSVCSGLIIFAFMMIVRFIGNKIFKRESIGGGDIKLSTFFGICLGLRLGFLSLIIGCLFAFPYALYLSFSNKEKELPFGPFLTMGLVVCFLFMDKITAFINLIFRF